MMTKFKVGDRVKYNRGEDEIIEKIEDGKILGRYCKNGVLATQWAPIGSYTMVKPKWIAGGHLQSVIWDEIIRLGGTIEPDEKV